MRRGDQIAGDRPPAVMSAIAWLRRRRTLSLSLALLGLVAILFVDLLVPGYAIAAAYLVLVVFAAIALPQVTAIVIGSAGLGLTLAVMAVQGRTNGENLLLIWFGVLAGAGMFALVALYNSVDALYAEQRESVERESFLVRLVDALLPLDDPLEVEETTIRLLGEQLTACPMAFFELDEAGRLVACPAYARKDSSEPLDLDAFAADLASAGTSRALVLPAAASGSGATERQRAALDAAGLRALLAAPIFEDGELIAAVAACDPATREWTGAEASLLEESVVRAWAEVRRARADEALRATESSLRDTLDSAVDGLYRLDMRTGRFDYLSPSAATVTGVPLEKLRTMADPLSLTSVHPDDRAEAARAALDLEQHGVAELDCRWAVSGTYRWYSGVMRLTRGEDGEPLFRTGTFRDVTEHKRRERNAALIAELQDELAQVTSAQDIVNATGARLGERLGVESVFLTQFDPEQVEGTVYVTWNDGQTRPFPSRGHLADCVEDEVVDALREGQTVVCRDAERDSRTHAEAYRAIGMRSCVMVPFRRDGDLTFAFCVADPEPREWRDDEVELLCDIAVRVLPRLERARAEEALRSSEERFRTIVTTANEGITMMGSDGRITFVNGLFAESLGYSVDEIVGMRPAELSADEDADKVEGELRERYQGTAGQYDLRLKTKDGASIWFLISAAPICDSDGDVVGAVGMFTDIDERKRQEAALALQVHLLDNVHDAICALDSSYRVTYWNQAAEEFFGWTPEEAVGRLSKDLLRGSIPGSTRDDALQSLLREGSFRGEVLYRHKDGSELWADVHSRLIRAEDGEVAGVIAAFRDIREQKRAQEALIWEAARLRAIVEAAPVGLGIVAADGEVLLRNEVLRDIWLGGAPVRSVDEFGVYKAFWPETGEQLKVEDWPTARALETGESFADVVVDIDRFDGSKGTIVLSTAPILNDGVILGAVTIAQDITAMRETEQTLRFLTEEVRNLHEAVVLDPMTSSTELARIVVAQAGLLLGSDGSSIFLLGDDGLRRVAGVGVPDGSGMDDLVAQSIGDQEAMVQPLPPSASAPAGSPGSVMLAVPLVIRGEAFGAMAFTYENRRSLEDNRVRIARGFADQAALAIENARLRARIEAAAIEAERTRLARDLHDSVTQSLFAATLKAEALAELLDDRQKALSAVEELRRLTRGSLAGMRTMLLEMRGDALEQTPLPELLRHLVEASGGRIGADVRLSVEGRRRQLPPHLQTAMYRIAQEALNNVARHAKASEVWVKLLQDDAFLRLEIGDDGRGFDIGPASASHFGLQNMRERSEAVGAGFSVVSGAGSGTVISVEWPLGEGDGEHE